MPKRESNNPKRRIADREKFDASFFEHMRKTVRYGGSANHKKRWADYGFDRPANPRPTKSLCDGQRRLLKKEAEELFANAIERQMISISLINDLPKYVWAVDQYNEPFEAKLGEDGKSYHGYHLGEDEEAMRKLVIHEWKVRA